MVVRQNCLNKSDCLIELSKIEMLVCSELPPELHAGIVSFQAEAKSEVGDKRRIWKAGGLRR
jgi:hypothetical protein